MPHHYDSTLFHWVAARPLTWRLARFGVKGLAALFLLACVAGPVADAAPTATEQTIEPRSVLDDTMPDWDKVRETAERLLTDASSPPDPLTYFIEPLGREMGLSDAAQTLAAKRIPKALAAELRVPELAESARSLIRDLATWNLATIVQTLSRTTNDEEIKRLSQRIREHAKWLKEAKEDLPLFDSILATIPGLEAKGPASSAGDMNHDQGYRDYAAALDEKFAAFSDGSDSWLAILERDGIHGWQERLRTVADLAQVGEEETPRFAERYTDSRLRPLLRLRVAQQGSDLETWAAERTYRHWLGLSQWKNAVRLRRGLTRLCGSWQWTVHNHQNHGDQKLVLSFPPPDAAPQNGGPAEIVALGDLIYLRWEAGGRVQEDSLLFANEGQRLEGTFVNNAGGWGSITGKRTAGCPTK